MRYFIGIDPGATGAIGVVDHHGAVAYVDDMPLYARYNVQIVDADFRLTFALPGAFFDAAVERVHSMPGQGVSSTFKFGMMFAGAIALAEQLATAHNPILVTPQTWKKHHGLIGADKDAARILAIEKWPNLAHSHLKRKKDCGRADALLIADWLRQKRF